MWRNICKEDDFNWLEGKGNMLFFLIGFSMDYIMNLVNGIYMYIEVFLLRW